MNKFLFFLFWLFIANFRLIAQTTNENIIYIIDSIPVINDPEEGNEIRQSDISDLTVIKNKDSLNLLGYQKFDGAIYIFTKEYRNRPDSLKQILSSNQMERKDKVWYFHGLPYTGRIIDYYYSGRKQGEGTFINGKVDGLRKVYFQNGKVKFERYYKEGIENGLDKEYYGDGSLQQQGEFVNGKEEGIWNDYYPNGQVKQYGFYKNGAVIDTAIKYYSNGKIKEKDFIKDGKLVLDPSFKKRNDLMAKSAESDKDGDTKSAIKYSSKVIELDSTYADAYFSRGTLELNDFQFDKAIADFDKALQLEPFLDVAFANRGFARIRKYQFKNSRTLENNSEVTVLASGDKAPIPEEEKEKICNDLQEAIFLGDKTKMITEAVSNYCQAKAQ